jgi:hypothetical protein
MKQGFALASRYYSSLSPRRQTTHPTYVYLAGRNSPFAIEQWISSTGRQTEIHLVVHPIVLYSVSHMSVVYCELAVIIVGKARYKKDMWITAEYLSIDYSPSFFFLAQLMIFLFRYMSYHKIQERTLVLITVWKCRVSGWCWRNTLLVLDNDTCIWGVLHKVMSRNLNPNFLSPSGMTDAI